MENLKFLLRCLLVKLWFIRKCYFYWIKKESLVDGLIIDLNKFMFNCIIQFYSIIIMVLIFLFIWFFNLIWLNMYYIDLFNNGFKNYEIMDIVYVYFSDLFW